MRELAGMRVLVLGAGISGRSAGDTLVLRQGPCAEPIGLGGGDFPYCAAQAALVTCAEPPVPGATAGNPVPIKPETLRTAILKPPQLATNADPGQGFYTIVFPMSWQWGVIDGIVVDSGNQTVYGQDIDFRERTGQGKPGNITLKNVEVKRSGTHTTSGDCGLGLTMQFDSGNYLIQNNLFSPRGGADGDGCYCIYFHAYDSIVEGNECNSSHWTGIQFYNTKSLAEGGYNGNNIFRNNYIHDAFGPGLSVSATGTGNKVYNNLLVYNGHGNKRQDGIEIGCDTAQDPVEVYNNTIVTSQAEAIRNCSANNIIRNNIFYQNGLNDIYNFGATGTVDQNNLKGTNPLFVGTPAGTPAAYAITSGSPARNTGTNASCPSTDYTGATRDGACDIGAFEYTGAVVTTDAPLAWWTFEEGTGTTAADTTGNGHTATLQNGVAWVTGRVGTKAVQCDGVDDELVVSGLLGTPSAVTITAWANVPALPAAGGGAELVSLGDYVALHLNASGPLGIYQSTSGSLGTAGVASLVNTGWHHYGWVVDPATSRQQLYVDGASLATSSAGAALQWSGLGTNTYLCMHGNGNTSKRLQGTLDEVKIWGRALSSAEIAAERGGRRAPQHRVVIK